MSVGSNLLAMLNNRASIASSSVEDSQKVVAANKNASGNSAQMRKCMKNFNFKLDYNEIDRIIEENEEGTAAGADQLPETTYAQP